MIPDGIREMPPAENGVSSPGVEDTMQNETTTPTDTCRADGREEEVQMSEDYSGHDEMTESGRQERTEENSCIPVNEQQCSTSSEVPPSFSEVGNDCNVDHDSSKQDDDLAALNQITDSEIKPSFWNADDEKVSKDDRQPTNTVAELTEAAECLPNEADTFHEGTSSETKGTESNTGITAEEDESRVDHRMFKHLLDSDTDNHNEEMVAQEQSVEQDELNDKEQPIQQTAKDTGETGDGKMSAEELDVNTVGDNDNVLEENASCEVVMNEYAVDESSKKESESESSNGITAEVVENNKESVTSEEAEQLSGNVPEQTSKLLQQMEESSAETAANAEPHPERNLHMPETPTKGDETHQQLTECTTNEKSDLANPDENMHVEQQLLVGNRLVEKNATKEAEETIVNSTNVCSRRSSEGDKSPEPTAEAQSTEQLLQSTELSMEKEETFVVDSVQSADSQPNGASEPVEETEEVSAQHTSCDQSTEGQSLHINECTNGQSYKYSGDDIQMEHTQNTEENVDANEVEDKALRLDENNDINQKEATEEAENGQNQGDAADKVDCTVEKSTESIKEVNEGTAIVTDKLTEQPDNRFDEGVAETSTNCSLYADQICSSSTANIAEQNNDNDIHCKEVDRNLQPGSNQSAVTSDTTQCEGHEVDYVSAQEESHNIQEAQEEAVQGNEYVQGQICDTRETSEIETVIQQNNAPELWADSRATKGVGEETLLVNHVTENQAEEETAMTAEIKENTDNRDSADITEQWNIKETEQNELTIITKPLHIITNYSAVNEAVFAVNKLVMHTSEEVSIGNNQPHEHCLNRESPEELENEQKSEKAVDKLSAVNNVECETKQAIEHSTSEEDTQQQEMAVTQEAQQSTFITEMVTDQPEREVPFKDKNLSDKETAEKHAENDNNEPHVENPDKHYETDSLRTAEVAEQPADLSEIAEDRVSFSAVEPCDKNTMKFNQEYMVKPETETERSTETVTAGENTVTESATPVNDSCISDMHDAQSTGTTNNMGQSDAGFDQQDRQENELPTADSIEATKENPENTTDKEQVALKETALNNVDSDVAEKTDNSVTNEHNVDEANNIEEAECLSKKAEESNEAHCLTVEAEKSDQCMAEENEITDTAPEPSHEKTSPPVEVAALCNRTVESITFASNNVYEVRTTETVTQQDSEEMSNHRATESDDPEPTQLMNRNNDSENSLGLVEKHTSIRTYIDDCRDIELSGMKLATEQVGLKAVHLLDSVIF